jgi:hypothetical protein
MTTYTAYPLSSDIGQLDGSIEEWQDDLLVERSVSGKAKARALYPAKKRRFSVQHRMTSAQYGDFKTFYDSYRLLSFTFTWAGDGNAYTCIFGAAPTVRPIGVDFQISSTLVEQ